MNAPDYIRALAVSLRPDEEYRLTGTLTPATIERLLTVYANSRQISTLADEMLCTPCEDEVYAPLDHFDEMIEELDEMGNLGDLRDIIVEYRDKVCEDCASLWAASEQLDEEVGKLYGLVNPDV